MFTFLSHIHRLEIEREYRKRLFSLICGLLAVLTFSGAVLALPSYIVMSVKKTSALSTDESVVPLPPIEARELRARATDIQAKVSSLDALALKKSLLSVIERVVAHSSKGGISITGISLKRGGFKDAISISGTAKTREALVVFTKGLEGEALFQNVLLPVSLLARASAVPFTISIDSRF